MSWFSKFRAVASLPQFLAIAVIGISLVASRSTTLSRAGEAPSPATKSATVAPPPPEALREPLNVPAGYRWVDPAEASYVVYDVWGEYFLPEPVYGLIVPVGMELDSDEAWGLVLGAAPRDLPPHSKGKILAHDALRESPGSMSTPSIDTEWAVDLQQRADRIVDYRAVMKTASGPLLVAARVPVHRLAEVRTATEALAAASPLADSTDEEVVL